MDDISENPFDPMSFALGDDLFGRQDELSWLMNGIRQQAQLLLFGGEGMGKSSLLEQAGMALAQRHEGWMIRLDLSLHRSTDDLVGSLKSATHQLQRSPEQAWQLGVLGDGGKKPVREQNRTSAAYPRSGDGSLSPDLFRTLGELNAFALGQRGSVVVAFDSCQEMHRFGGERFENTVMAAVESHAGMSHILCGDEHGLKAQSTEGMRTLQGAFQVEKLGPLEPHAFARWIDARFQSSAIVTRGVGAACVDLAGPNTAQTVELAQRTFELSFRARFANEATVQAALGQAVAAKTDQFAQTWSSLSAQERSVLLAIGKGGGQGLLEPNAYRRCGLASDDQARSAIHSLVDKRLLDPTGPAGVRIQSAAMKRWTLQAHLGFGKEQKPDGSTAQALAFSLNFQRFTSSVKNKSIAP